MYIDDLPIWGKVGEKEDNNKYYVYTHKKFEIGWNGRRIVDVNLTTEKKELLVVGAKISFTYEVTWKHSETKFEDRFDKYLDPNFFQHRIHWFSIFNSFMMVIFLVGLVSMILMRTLRKDYARYSKDEEMDDMERDLGDEYGWKQVHGDVFRSPTNVLVFSSLIGAGYQLTLVVFLVVVFAILGELYTEYNILPNTIWPALSDTFISISDEAQCFPQPFSSMPPRLQSTDTLADPFMLDWAVKCGFAK